MSEPAVKVVEGAYAKDQIEYERDKDVYACPTGEELTCRFESTRPTLTD